MMPVPSLYSLFKDPLNLLKINPRDPSGGFVRLETTLEAPVDIMAWIAGADTSERFYFKNKDNSYEIGGLGNACTIGGNDPRKITDRLYQLWDISPEIKVFGAMNFFPDQENTAEWEMFEPFCFTLPFVEMTRENTLIRVTLNYDPPENKKVSDIKKDITDSLKKMDAKPERVEGDPAPVHTKTLLYPDQDTWNKIIDGALTHIRTSDIQKVVLARKKVLMADHNWHPADLLKQLATPDENSFLFLYQISQHNAFLGRSPERLFEIHSRKIAADAIAGSNPRGKTAQEDKDFEDDLLQSSKELEEHRVVTEYIEKQMNTICASHADKEKETILKLKNIQHIISRYRGTLKRRVNPFTVLQAFHPTPAVGGHPSQAAQALIKKLEPFERGWYTGPVGWMNRDNAEFAVGIRSALINRKELHVFAGAGIVNQSNALDEWLETENKMDNFSDITGGS